MYICRVPNFIFGQCVLGNENSYKGNNEYFTLECDLNADFLDPKCVHTEIIQRIKDLIYFYTLKRGILASKNLITAEQGSPCAGAALLYLTSVE